MEEKNLNEKGLVAVTKEFAEEKLKEFISNSDNKKVLDEYFMWIKVLNSEVKVVSDDKLEDTK